MPGPDVLIHGSRWRHRGLVAATTLVVVGALGLGACSAGPTGTSAGGTTTRPGPTSSGVTPTTTTSVPVTSNLVVTSQVRSELVAAGAALNSLAASDYTGLAPGETYYAYDASTGTYWAGAALVPSPSSTPAQVAAQDDGAYLLFDRPAGGSWKAYAVGLAGTPDGSTCPIAVPAAIVQLWNWTPGSCRPSTLS